MASFSINEIIEMAVQIERSGYAFYDQALKESYINQRTSELLTTLRDQEKKHEDFFNSLRNKEDMELIIEDNDWETVSSYLKAIIDYRIFNSPESAIKTVLEAKSERELVDKAISFEKDTLLYFQGIKDVLKDSKAKEILDKIVREEISHILYLTIHKDKMN